MIKFHRILLLTLVAVFLASAAGIARYAADSCTQSRMYRQLAAQTENFPGDAASPGNDFLPQYQALYAQNSDLAGWIQIDGTNINYPVMQSKHDPDFYLKHNFEKADSPHGCPYVQANCDLQTPSDNILVYGHNMKDGTMFSDLLQYKREFFWEQIRSYVKNHIPVACHAVGSGSRQHWFVAYELTGESGGTWATAGIKVLDPYNSNSGSTEGRRVTILEAMQTSHVTLGVDRIRIPN